MLRRMCIVLVMACGVAGCRNIEGPCAAWHKPRADLPGLTIEEQQRRARDKYAIPEDDFRTGPNMELDRSGPTGR